METLRSKFFPKLDLFHLMIIAIGAGVVMRIAGVTTSAIWFDEAVSTFNSRLPFFTMIQAAKYTNSPPLWEIILWLNVRIFGESEFAIRLPSLVVGIFTLWLVYRLTYEFGLSAGQRWFALLLVALLPSQIGVAQDGRIYAILAALYLMAIWFAIHNRWVGLTACAGLLLYAHFSAPFYLVALYVGAICYNGVNWKSIRNTLMSGLFISVAFIPWLSALRLSMLAQSNFPPLSPFYLLKVMYQTLFLDDFVPEKGYVWIVLGAIAISLMAALILGIMLLFKQMLTSQQHQDQQVIDRRYLQFSIFALGPLLSLVFLGIFANLIYYRPLTGMVIPLILWVVYTLGQGLKHQIFKNGLAVVWIIILFVSLANWSPAAKGGNIRMVTDLIDHRWRRGDIIYHVTGTTFLPFNFYQPQKETYLLDDYLHLWLLPSQLGDIYGLKRASLESLSYKRVWIVYARDPLIPSRVHKRVARYIQTGVMVGRVDIWRFAPIEVYLVTGKQP